MRVAVMGCVVNGPGESKHADIGISLPGTFEEPVAPVFVDGALRRRCAARGWWASSSASSTTTSSGATLWRAVGDEAEFITLSFWESEESIRRFAGDETSKAVFYPEDDRFLVRRELTVEHYRLVGIEGESG
jgi:hypothetical protein